MLERGDSRLEREAAVHRCRECDMVLLRTRPACPECRAQRPELRLGALGRRDRTAALPWTAAGGAAVPLLLAVDHAARWLLHGA